MQIMAISHEKQQNVRALGFKIWKKPSKTMKNINIKAKAPTLRLDKQDFHN